MGKIIITENQFNQLTKKLLSEAVGVPENILDEGRELYEIVKNELKNLTSIEGEYEIEDIEIDITVSDVNFTHLNMMVKVDEIEEYNGKEALIASMGVGNEFNFEEGIMMQVNAESSSIDLMIQFIVSENWDESDLYDAFVKDKTHSISVMSHELMHRFRRSKKQKGLAGETADYQAYSSSGLNFGIPVISEFMRFSYFIQNEENVVRPTEVASRMVEMGITREQFYNFITEDQVFKELKQIQNFSFEYLINSLKEQMGRVDELLDYAGEDIEDKSEDEKIRMVLELVYVNLSNAKMENFERFILSRQEMMYSRLGPFAQLMGAKPPSENKVTLLKKYHNHVTKYANREMEFFKDECERFNYISTKLMKRIAKIYSLIPDEKEQTNESIINWELHQKLMEKKYGKRKIETKYRY